MPDVIEGFRLSPQQRTLWRHIERDGHGPYRAQLAALIEGPLDAARVEAALTRLVERHEILRTTFQHLPGVALPVQVISDPAPVTLVRHDASAVTDGHEIVGERFEAARQRVLDATKMPAFEAELIEFHPAGNVLLLGAPVLCADVRALEELVGELLRELSGEEPAATEAAKGDEGPLQYADLAEWQNELIEGEDGREGLAQWRASGLPARPPTDLPIARATDAAFAPEWSMTSPGKELTAALEDAAERAGVGLERFVLAAWLVLLWRRSGQEERWLGVRLDGRRYEELEHAPGLFERELPLALEVRPEESFEQLVARVCAAFDAVAERQEAFAWDKVLDGDGDEAPYLPVGFGWRDHRVWHKSGELSARTLLETAHVQPFALRLVCGQSPSGVVLGLQRDGARIGGEDAARILDEMSVLLADAVQDPTREVRELRVLSAEAERTVLATTGETSAEYPRERCIHSWIEQHASEAPEATAVICGDVRLSYGELDARADAVARRLVELGAGPNVRVGLSVERSPEMLVGLLGILKSGAGYVPVDPGYPAERIAFLLSDAKCPVLLTQAHLEAGLPAHDATVVRLDADRAALEASGSGPVDATVGPDDLAYVIYTSGSTGRPKGVEIRHCNLVHSTTARFDYYPQRPERYLLVSSYAFDSSVVGLFWTLCTGGTLVLPVEGRERDVRELAGLVEEHEVTAMLALPSLHGLMLEHGGAERLRSLNTVIVAGEACTRDLVEKHRSALPGARLYDEYGPTEATVWCTVFDCTALGAEGPVPIGKPIANARAYLLDAWRRPVPLGAPGELWVAGDGVARGYLDRDELTAERFLPDPFHGEEGARMYRTGDLARWLPSGDLEFLGRVDHQVKVRGYRVELGEIEDALTAHPDVSEAAVLAREDTPGDQRLVAYVVGSPVEALELQDALRARLPDYMIPAAIVALDDLPRTPNGKVNRDALPAPEASRAALSAAYVAPRTPLEVALADVWAEVLRVEQVGAEDDFFELGGHSILAVRLVARVSETFGVELGLRTLFDAPTVAGLVAALEADPVAAEQLRKAAEILGELAELSDDEVDEQLGERA